jgi:hypothetical protein
MQKTALLSRRLNQPAKERDELCIGFARENLGLHLNEGITIVVVTNLDHMISKFPKESTGKLLLTLCRKELKTRIFCLSLV